MKTREAAAKWGVSLSAVKTWLYNGAIPGAYKVPTNYGMAYFIPDDAPCPPKNARHGMKRTADCTCPPKGSMSNRRYIAMYGASKSTASIAETLGITTKEVRAIYDRLTHG